MYLCAVWWSPSGAIHILRARMPNCSSSCLAPPRLAPASYAAACPSLPLSSAEASRLPHQKKDSLTSLPSDSIFPRASAPDHHRLPLRISLIHLRINYTVTKARGRCITASLSAVILWRRDPRNRLAETNSTIAVGDFNLKRYICFFSFPFKVLNDLYHSNKSAGYVVMSHES